MTPLKHNKLLTYIWFLIKKILLIFGKKFANKTKLIFLRFLIHFGISNSQNRMDKKILNLCKNKTNGFFIEVGAYDGINYSNTYLLEKKYDWRGLLIEPLKKEYEICKKYRANSIVVNNILSNYQDLDKYFKITHSGLESLIVDHAHSLMPSDHLNKKSLQKNNNYIKSTTLDNLLKTYDIKHVDILIVDVEGFEINLLDGFSLEGLIDYILIETYSEKKLMEYCKKRSWTFIQKFTDNDYLFKPRGK